MQPLHLPEDKTLGKILLFKGFVSLLVAGLIFYMLTIFGNIISTGQVFGGTLEINTAKGNITGSALAVIFALFFWFFGTILKKALSINSNTSFSETPTPSAPSPTDNNPKKLRKKNTPEGAVPQAMNGQQKAVSYTSHIQGRLVQSLDIDNIELDTGDSRLLSPINFDTSDLDGRIIGILESGNTIPCEQFRLNNGGTMNNSNKKQSRSCNSKTQQNRDGIAISIGCETRSAFLN